MEPKLPFEHVMVDIETMGNISYSAILSIGAIEFDINTGKTGREFHRYVDLQDCLDEGLVVNGDTILWWLWQSDEARAQFSQKETEHLPLSIALKQFTDFCFVNPGQYFWGNSARFDLGLLQNAYNKQPDPAIPWDFRKERDVRTLVALAPEVYTEYKMVKREGQVLHNALSDCRDQIGYCSAIWQHLTNQSLASYPRVG